MWPQECRFSRVQHNKSRPASSAVVYRGAICQMVVGGDGGFEEMGEM